MTLNDFRPQAVRPCPDSREPVDSFSRVGKGQKRTSGVRKVVAGLSTSFAPKVLGRHTVLPAHELEDYKHVTICRGMRQADQIIKSDRRRDGSRRKAENQGGQAPPRRGRSGIRPLSRAGSKEGCVIPAGQLFRCHVAPSHPSERATIRRQNPPRMKHFTKSLETGSTTKSTRTAKF